MAIEKSAHAQLLSTKDAGWRVFLVSLMVLVILRAPGIATTPRAHLNLRIFMLGWCVGGLVLHLTSSLAASVAIAIAIWAPKPIIEWRRRWRALDPPDPADRVCPPIPSAAGSSRRPPMGLARAWLHAWILVHVRVFRLLWIGMESFNDRVFSLFVRLAMRLAQTREPLHQAVARGDARKVEALVRQNPASLSEPDAQGRTPLHVALERLMEAMEEEEEEGEAETADGDAISKEGQPIMRGPTSAEWLEMIRCLLRHKASGVDARDAEERLPTSRTRTHAQASCLPLYCPRLPLGACLRLPLSACLRLPLGACLRLPL